MSKSKIKTKPGSGLKDSGMRESTVTGALREPSPVEAGRYDLIPPECLLLIATADNVCTWEQAVIELVDALAGNQGGADSIEAKIARFVKFGFQTTGGSHRLAVHYARGAIKYAERNWEKGLETGRTVSSLLRHLDKLQKGYTDEDHAAAVQWNAIALMFFLPRLRDGRLPKELDTYGFLARST